MGVIVSWLGAAGGIAFPFLLFAGMALEPQDPPGDDTRDEAWADYYLGDAARFRAGFYLEGAAWALLLVFLGALGARLAEAEAGDRTLSRVAIAAGVVIVVLSLVSFAFRWTLTWSDTHEGFADVPSRTLALVANTVFGGLFSLSMYLLALLAGAAGFSMLRTGSFPRWLAWASVVAGVLAALHSLEALAPDAAWVDAVHTAGFAAFLLWPLLVGATLAARLAKRPGPTSVEA